MCRWSAYSILLLCLTGTYVAAEERYGEWMFEEPRPRALSLSFKRSLSQNDRIVTSELGFVCDSGAILIPFDGMFQNHQPKIPLVIQKDRDQNDPSDLLQHWQNAGEYIFTQSRDELDELASFLKAREAEGTKSVHLYFPNDLDAGPQITSHIVINLSGFSEGFDALQKSCSAEH
jgi:hypothetical protein